MSASSVTDRFTAVRHLAETLAIAAAGGAALGLIGVPAGWLSGSILAVAGASLAGRPMLIPTFLMRAIFVLIGISLGAVVTPETLHGMATYPVSIAVLILAMALISVGGAGYLRLIHRWDNVDAYLAAAPGGMSQVLALGAELGGDLRAIAIVQSIRVVVIAVGLPAGLSMLGLVGQAPPRVTGGLSIGVLDELAILVAASTIVAIIAYRIRFPGGLLFGAMLTSAVLHGSGLIHAVMPWGAANTAMVAMGAITGSRFANTPLRMLLNFVGAAFGSFAVAVTIAAAFAAVLISVLSLRAAEVMIAFAPGSVDAMMLLALALNLDPVYVGAHHLTRIFFVSLTMPLVARRTARSLKIRSEPPKQLPKQPPKPPLKPPLKRPPFQD
ncbi:MAG TPA: AbrB family transcriptional regulator [Pseudolabrys sp.]|nr:AbrB family transcriptional regulator [Pseudolabrys sp.]